MPQQVLDPQSVELLEILEERADLPLEVLAAQVGLSVEETRRRIETLKERRILRKLRAIVDWERTGHEHVYAFVDVRVKPEHDVGFDAIARQVALFDEVHSLYLMSGQYDLLVVVEGESLKDIATFVAEKLAPLRGVESTATSFVLKKYKVDGENFVSEHEDRRLPVAP